MTIGWSVSSSLLCRYLLILLLSACPASGLLADSVPNWERAAALQAADLQEGAQQVRHWLQKIDAGQAAEVLAELQQTTANGTPAFEAQLHSLALSMAEAVPDTGNHLLLAWLENYPSVVLVAHEESALFGVPLFPVAAAARGSRLEWQRQAARLQSAQLIPDPQNWIQAYLAAKPVERQGLEQGLRMATVKAIGPLTAELQARLSEFPELAAPAGIVAGSLVDESLFLAALQHSQGAATVQILREAGWRLDAAQRSQLFNELLASAKTVDSVRQSTLQAAPESATQSKVADSRIAVDKAALGISLLAPGLHSNPKVSQHLLELLGDPELGAAAALALAGHPDSQVQAGLRKQLQQGGLAGRRAALALDTAPVDPLQSPAEGDPAEGDPE